MSVIDQNEWDNYCQVLRAWYEGKTVQFKDHDEWFAYTNISTPRFMPDTQWRIKPESLKYKVVLLKNKAGQYTTTVHNHEQSEWLRASNIYIKDLTHWVEVED
jgi:hypothetical protein